MARENNKSWGIYYLIFIKRGILAWQRDTIQVRLPCTTLTTNFKEKSVSYSWTPIKFHFLIPSSCPAGIRHHVWWITFFSFFLLFFLWKPVCWTQFSWCVFSFRIEDYGEIFVYIQRNVLRALLSGQKKNNKIFRREFRCFHLSDDRNDNKRCNRKKR